MSYHVSDRKNDPGYDTYQSNSERIQLITGVFPVFLFTVVTLVSLSTMTHFIDEGRQNIGVLKVLGYNKSDTSLRFIVYSLTTALTGVLIGVTGDYWLLPRIIFNSYTASLTPTNFQTLSSQEYLFLTIFVAVLCTTGTALIQLFLALRAETDELLLPKPPKNGSRIFLERIKLSWRRLGSNYKVTLRSTFCYRIKVIMIILGIMECTGLLMMGFDTCDSLAGIDQGRYGELIRYGLIAADKNDSFSNQN